MSLPEKRYRRNVRRPAIKPLYTADPAHTEKGATYGVWIPGHPHPVAQIKLKADDKVTLEIMQNGLAGRLSVWPEISNVIRVEMERG